MKKALLAIAIAFGALVLCLAVWAGVVWAGWLPVPRIATDLVAQWKGMTPAEAADLNTAVNVYQVLKRTPEAPYVDRAVGLMAQRGNESKDKWVNLAKEAWPAVTPDTLAKVRDQLGIDQKDFDEVKAIVDRQMTLVEKTGEFDLTAAESERLNKFAVDYHLVEMLVKYAVNKN
jgi:hypothetical protein